MDVVAVFLAALVTALATGLGAAPFFLAHSIGQRSLGLSNAAAAGFMLAASTVLVWEGGQRGPLRLIGGALVGALAVALTRRLLARRHDVLHLGALRGADAFKAIGIVAVMTVHSVTEGVGVGVSYGDGKTLGIFITAAIAVHNIPEGLAISLVLVPRGTRPIAAAWWSVFSSLPQPLLAVPAFVFVESFSTILPAGLGFAAGAMAWMVMSELLPEARATASGRSVALVLGIAFAAMMGLQALLLAA